MSIAAACFSIYAFEELKEAKNAKTAYVVDFETNELIRKAIAKINLHLHVSKIFFTVTKGTLESIKSKEILQQGEGFKEDSNRRIEVSTSANANVKYDLVGKVVEETGLTRKSIVDILTGIDKHEEKATAIIQHIAYNKLDDSFGTEVFTVPTIKGKLGVNPTTVNKHLYDTPVGIYNPDWAIAFNKGMVGMCILWQRQKVLCQHLILEKLKVLRFIMPGSILRLLVLML